MTKFLLISDTHWGSDSDGYKVQPKYGSKLPELLTALQDWIDENGSIDFILHGGDMIHTLDEESLTGANERFDLSIPVHLCLGNHDLTIKDGLSLWLDQSAQFFEGGSPDYAVETKDVTIHVIPNQYEEDAYYWGTEQNYHYKPSQLEILEARLTQAPHKPQVILTHCPVHAIEPSQSGLDKPFHEPPKNFTETVVSLAEEHNVACVLGAHSHANMHKELNGTHYVTVSSFVETPFEFKCFEVENGRIQMKTHNLWSRIGFDAEYNWDKTFAQGRACDRSFVRESVNPR